MRLIARVAHVLVEVLAPSRCALCDTPCITPCCTACSTELPWLADSAPVLDTPVVAAWRYEEPVATALRRMKYGDRPDLVASLVRLAAPSLERRFVAPMDLFVPVPLHPSRLAERGFNQAALLARAFRRELLPVFPSAMVLPRGLRRRTDTGQLAGKSREERRRAISGAFAVRSAERVAGRRVLLVDDVVTTGSTALACIEALNSAGAIVTGVLALCRATGTSVSGQ